MSRPDPQKISEGQKQILSYNVNTVARLQEEKFPEVWRRMYTKTIDASGNYYPSRALAVSLTGAIVESRATIRKLETNLGFIAGILEKYDFPMYYVSEPLFEALKRSHPPKDLAWSDIQMPFPAITFMIPRGSLMEPGDTGGPIMFIGAALLPKGVELNIPTVGRVAAIKEDRISVFWSLAPSGIVVQDVTFPRAHPLEPIAVWIDMATRLTKGDTYIGPPTPFSVRVAGLVANLILVMEARKELVEPGKVVRKKLGNKLEIRTPTFIGRNYVTLRKGPREDAKGHFTELGWRSGHFKRQHFGEKREQAKTIWVDPYIALTRGLKPIEEEKA